MNHHYKQDFVQLVGIYSFLFLCYMNVCVCALPQHLRLLAIGFDRHYLLLVLMMSVIYEASVRSSEYTVECKCCKLSCEHIAFSIMWHFLGSSQELFLPPILPPLLVAPSYKHMIRLSLCLKTWQTNNLATCYCKLHGILAACAMSVLTEKQDDYSERKALCTSFSSAWLCARSQPAAVFTQRPWHSGPVTPTGLWHQPGEQPKQWQKAAKKANNNRHVPHLLLSWPFEQGAGGHNPKRPYLFCATASCKRL